MSIFNTKFLSIITILLISIITSGCSITEKMSHVDMGKYTKNAKDWIASRKSKIDNEESINRGTSAKDNLDDLLKIMKEERMKKERELAEVCVGKLIPAKYAEECFFRKLEYCEEYNEGLIPQEKLDSCAPIFIRDSILEELEGALYN